MATQQRPRTLFKITVLGDGGVGKTALTVQFTMASFVETYDPTIEDCYRKQWAVDGQPCMLEVLDTAGQEEYTALRDQWIRDGEGFLVVYSVASRQTFDRVDSIVRRIHRVKDESAAYGSPTTSPGYGNAPGSRLPVVILGNKRDLPGGREVSPDEGARLAQRLGADFFETSAKTGVNVEKAFQSVVRGIKVAKGGGNVGGSGAGASPGVGGTMGQGGNQMGGGGGGQRRNNRRGGGGRKCVIL